MVGLWVAITPILWKLRVDSGAIGVILLRAALDRSRTAGHRSRRGGIRSDEEGVGIVVG